MIKRNRTIAFALSCMMLLGSAMPSAAAKPVSQITVSAPVAGAALVSKVNTASTVKNTIFVDPAVAGIAVSINTFNENNTDKTVSDVLNQVVEDAKPSPYKDIAISQVKNYVNIRSKATTDSEIVGKIYNNAAAKILDTVKGEDGDWYQIKSGSVKGYMKAEYFKTGKEAEKIAKKVGNVLCKTTATTLRLREEPSTDSRTLMLLAEDSIYSVKQEDIVNDKGEEFIKVLVMEGETRNDDISGYVAKEYVDVYVDFEKAISVAEEQAEIARQEALRRAEREAISSDKGSNSGNKKDTNKKPSSGGSSGGTVSGGSGKGRAIAAKAQQYANRLRYVWGGSSLSKGADCSGFAKAIYANYGISLPRTSSAQARGGRTISKSQLQPGDLVFYASRGRVYHVGIYIGGGKICHEANTKRGCKIDSMTYCGSPYKYVTYTHK